MALGSPISHSSSEGNLGVALESLQGQRDLTKACVRELIFLSREGRDLGVAFQAPPGSQASSRGEAKDKVAKNRTRLKQLSMHATGRKVLTMAQMKRLEKEWEWC